MRRMVWPSNSTRITRRTSLLALSALATPAWSEPLTVRYPNNITVADPQRNYVADVLRLALQHAGLHFELSAEAIEMSQLRTFMEIARGGSSLDLMWTMTNQQRESSAMIPIRIPIDKGLLGWRLLLVRKSDVDRWRHVASIEDLKGMELVQGHDWPDTEILKANGLHVGTSSDYNSLFRMLLRGRVDAFPRSVLEIGDELKLHTGEDMAVAPDLMLYYPAPFYFFVSPSRPELAEHIRHGMESCIADGSLNRLFNRYYHHLWPEFQLDGRRILRLDNPLLPPLTPLQRKELWLLPNEPGPRAGVNPAA